MEVSKSSGLLAFYNKVAAQLSMGAADGARPFIGPAAPSFSVLFPTEVRAVEFVRAVRGLSDDVRFPFHDSGGDLIFIFSRSVVGRRLAPGSPSPVSRTSAASLGRVSGGLAGKVHDLARWVKWLGQRLAR